MTKVFQINKNDITLHLDNSNTISAGTKYYIGNGIKASSVNRCLLYKHNRKKLKEFVAVFGNSSYSEEAYMNIYGVKSDLSTTLLKSYDLRSVSSYLLEENNINVDISSYKYIVVEIDNTLAITQTINPDGFNILVGDV